MYDLCRRTIFTITVFHIIISQSAAQTRTGLNTNAISDRVFQNTVLSRRPIPSNVARVQTISSPRRSNGGRIRVLDLTNLSRAPSGNRINPVISQRLRQISGTQRSTNRILPTRQTGSRQLRTQQSRRRVSLVPQRQSSRRMLMMPQPTGTRQVRITRPTSQQMSMPIRRTIARQSTGLAASPVDQRSPVKFRPGPLTRDPRTGLVIQRITAQRRRPVPNLRPIGRVPRCPVNTQYMCRPFPRNVDRRRARRCVGNCRTGRCVVICLCACSPQTNQIRRLVTRPQRRRQGQRRNQVQGQNRSSVSGRMVPAQLPADLNFTMDSSVLARLLAEPDLNILVGPEGINQILRGEPPSILPRRAQRERAQERASLNQTSSLANNTAVIEMGVPIPSGITQSPVMPGDPMLANMLTSGESLREIGSEISTELLRSSFPSLTEFQRPDNTVRSGFNTNNNVAGQPPTAYSLDADFLGAILQMPSPISLSRDPQSSRGKTSVVVDPTLLDSGVIEPVRGFSSPRSRLRSMRTQARVLENFFDASSPIESLSDVFSGGNLDTAALSDSRLNMNDIISSGSRTGALSRDSQLLGNEPSEVAIMAAMMQSLGGAVDAVSAANARNSSAAPSRSRDISRSGIGGMAANQSDGNVVQNFLRGTVKSTDQTMSIPTINECLAQGRELWCDPLGIWENTPGITRWCLTNCRSLNPNVCDENRCECKCVDPETYRRNFINLTGSSV